MSGNEITKAQNLSETLASSETQTIINAVIIYFKTRYVIIFI